MHDVAARARATSDRRRAGVPARARCAGRYRRSLEDAWCEAEGINERIPLKLLSEKETRELVDGEQATARTTSSAPIQGAAADADRAVQDRGQALARPAGDRRALRAAAARRAPKIGLVLGPQVKTRSGHRARDAAAPRLQGAAGVHRETDLPAREQGRGVPAGDADHARHSMRRCRATAAGGIRLKSGDGKTYEPDARAEREDGRGASNSPDLSPRRRASRSSCRASFTRRRRARAGEQVGFPARDRHRRIPAARQVSRALRHPRAERRAAPAGHRAQRRSRRCRGARVELPATARTPIPGRAVRIIDDETAIIQRFRAASCATRTCTRRENARALPARRRGPAIAENEKTAALRAAAARRRERRWK